MLKQRVFAVFPIFFRRIFFGVLSTAYALKRKASVVVVITLTTTSPQI